MPKLKKFYELINRNARVTLVNGKLDKVLYQGSIQDIPDSYDDWNVADFSISSQGNFLFKIKE